MKFLFLLMIIISCSTIALATTLPELQTEQKVLRQKFNELNNRLSNESHIHQLIQEKNTAELRIIVTELESFFHHYDQFNLDKIDYFLGITFEKVKQLQTELITTLGNNNPILSTSNSLFLDIEKNYHLYHSRKKLFGTGTDYLRVEAGRDFLNLTGDWANAYKKLHKNAITRIWGTKILPFVDTLGEASLIKNEYASLLYACYFKNTGNKANEAPIIDALRLLSKKLAMLRGTKTAWRGLDHLPPMPLDGKTLHILVFMHANSFFDTAVQAELKLKGLSSIGNVDIIFPKMIANRMIKSDHIVTVGHGDTMTKTVNLVRNKKINKFFIAPEGLTPVGFYEMRPLVTDFAEAIYEAQNRGLQVEVYPISFPENFRMLNDWRKPIEGNKISLGVIHPPVHDEEIKTLFSVSQNPQDLSTFIRWFWFGDLRNSEELDIGMPSPYVLSAWLDGMIWGNL